MLEGEGRVLIRPSGTEPLVRVMLEGQDVEQITDLAEETGSTSDEKVWIKERTGGNRFMCGIVGYVGEGSRERTDHRWSETTGIQRV